MQILTVEKKKTRQKFIYKSILKSIKYTVYFRLLYEIYSFQIEILYNRYTVSRSIFVIVSSLQFVISCWSDVCRPHHLGSPRENNNIGGDQTGVQVIQVYRVWGLTVMESAPTKRLSIFSLCEQWLHRIEAIHPNNQGL